jgi:16S rRNA A1518/A1519 N6-dimethyltransferase RsmA/KsgA/DIM1 with predicted DNA glycosylase/AP lyase activity
VLTKPWYEIEILGEIDRTNFTQKPQIRIVFVKFVKRDRSFIADEDRKSFENFVIYGFNQWKESFGEAYKKILTHSQLITIKKMFGVDGQKPSEIDFDTWLRLYKNFKKIRNREQEDEMEIFVKRWRKKE